MSRKFKLLPGLTLVEMMLVVSILSTLVSIDLIAINPARTLAQTNNTQRWLDVNTIERAIQQYAIDNQGRVPANIPPGNTEICRSEVTDCAGRVNLSVLSLDKRYIVRLPIDPTGFSASGTGYFVSKDRTGRVTVKAPNAQLGTTIEISL